MRVVPPSDVAISTTEPVPLGTVVMFREGISELAPDLLFSGSPADSSV
jgi:hypothetical protein